MANIYINALNSPIHLIRKVKLFILLIFIALNVQYITAVKQTGEHRSLVTIVKQGNGESCHSFLFDLLSSNKQSQVMIKAASFNLQFFLFNPLFLVSNLLMNHFSLSFL